MRKPAGLLVIAACALALAGVLRASGADARVEAESDYTKAQTYNGALRYVRVDLAYEVVEKDADAAYILFRYETPGRRAPTNGSIEIVEVDRRVRVFVQLPQMPGYHETVLRDGLMKKLRAEYGTPPKRRPEPPAAPSGDAGAD